GARWKRSESARRAACAVSAISSAPSCSTLSRDKRTAALLVTIAGRPGSGTSTVARAVAARLGIERIDGGTVWRAMAAERGESVAAFSRLSERDPSYDLELDTRLAARAREGDLVLEARLSGWI